ncbi:P-loop containing nucleoside triphosphate hydrolase protein [Irpex lacteus]|nr:P-loop containing nucleoside triphosphate hydrolase protein [Irpex lacteus]
MSAKKTNISKKHIRVQLDAIFHDPARLQDEIALQNAMGVLMGHLKDPMVNKKSLLVDLLSEPNLFEFIFAGLSDNMASSIKEYIESVFLSSVPSFKEQLSLALPIRLSRYFSTLDNPTINLADQYRRLQESISNLASLSSLSLPKNMRKPSAAFLGAGTRVESDSGARRTSQLDRMNVERVTAADLLSELNIILVEYLDVLRRPGLESITKEAYITLLRDSGREPEADGEDIVDTDTVDETVDVVDNVIAAAPESSDAPPMKAALRFKSAKCFEDWHIVISARVIDGLRNARRQCPERFIVYMKKMRELSKGHFYDDNYLNLVEKEDNTIPIYAAKMTNGSCFVYWIDCVREYGDELERQVIKIADLCTSTQLEKDTRVWINVSRQLHGRGKEYRKRCILRLEKITHAGNKGYFPANFKWNLAEKYDNSFTGSNLENLNAKELQDLHERVVLEKFTPFSQALLNSILADEEALHVLLMSPTEQDIVRHEGSTYVLGRSGTGKTTAMLFKMLAVEQAHETSSGDGRTRPRQLFVTQAQDLVENIERHYFKLGMCQTAAQRTARESSKLAATQNHEASRDLFDKDEEEICRGTLPLAFSELTDQNFPLFITFDHLCRLLEADQIQARGNIGSAYGREVYTKGYMLESRKSFVSYHKFRREYWSHLPQEMTKKFTDPALVFAEIMGVIKGSEGSLQNDQGFLTREDYVNLSHRAHATFTSLHRGMVYSLFEAYTRTKRERQEWDAADRHVIQETHSILRGIRESGMQGQKVDFIYVDEAQDNLLIDALLIRSTCKDFNGLLWAGDTAQTISAGSSFRFEDLKAFLFRIEEANAACSLTKQFQLTTNYRSHGGIVKAAQSIVELLTKFWPYTIDLLSREEGIIGGTKPQFFTCAKEDRNRFEEYIFGTPKRHFGAHQCILVRDDAARDELRKRVGDIGTVLTLYESKGLEFNDVLLYNFFQDSTVEKGQWRVILNDLPDKEAGRCPSFNPSRHNGVCRELKFLYVAITRARQKLWIADCSENSEPLRILWTKQKFADNITVTEDAIPCLASDPSSLEWAETGNLLFHKKQYFQASRAFARAGLSQERDIAEAYYRREAAQLMPPFNDPGPDAHLTKAQAFLEAARAFSACADLTSSTEERIAYHRIADECYHEAAEIDKAATAP